MMMMMKIAVSSMKPMLLRDYGRCSISCQTLTQIQGCLRAPSAVILLAGLMVSIWLMRFLASGVTVSHSGEGN